MNIRQVIRGKYVATPIKNAFNNKTSYWFSKKGCTLALYMFTVGNGDSESDFEKRLSEKGFEEIIPRFEEELRRPFNSNVYFEEKNKLENDRKIEKMWEELTDVPVDEDECLDVDWQYWNKGTHREEIWYWFDEHHSKGIGWLMNEYENEFLV